MPTSKSIVRYAFFLLTAGLGYLLCVWFVFLKIKLTFSYCDLDHATHVIIKGAGKIKKLIY